MSDTLRTYRAIREGLHQLYGHKPKGRLAQTVDVLAWFIVGIVKSGKCQLPAIATESTYVRRESRVKQLTRFLKNERIDKRCSYLWFAKLMLKALAKRVGRFVLVIDGSVVGKGCRALVVSVVFYGRALPLAYLVETGPKGHFGEAKHLALLRQVKAITPSSVEVIFLGDGEFDGVELLKQVEKWGWTFACRTARNARLEETGEEGDRSFAFHEIGVRRGNTLGLWGVRFTQARYGPVLAVAAWNEEYEEPIYLVSNLATAEETVYWYQKRFRIETFFSDQKSRGFHLHQSHLSDPKRLARLMIAACLAYLWIVFLGKTAQRGGWVPFLHRSQRCDLSLFQLGRILLKHLLTHSLPILSSFLLPVAYPCAST